MDVGPWQARLDELAASHEVPGASLAVLVGDELTTLTTGVLNIATGVEVTTDSLFQIGSISKVYTATVLMRLVETGRVDLDQPVAEVVPEFRLAEHAAAGGITVRHLLTHTSGIDGDFFRNTGRGDDCLERYVEACAALVPAHAPGMTMSYCNVGYSILGRIVEVVTGKVWDDALAALLLVPLGLRHTHTLPENVLRYRAAIGHETGADGQLRHVSTWGLPRSAGPAGTISASAADLIAFARLHMRNGLAPDGTRVLGVTTAAAMRVPQVTVPNPWGKGDRWGLGWALFDWDDREVYGHDGATIGQLATLRVVSAAGVAVALLANSDCAGGFLHQVTSEVLQEVAGLSVPARLGAPGEPAAADAATLLRHVGTYERAAVRFEVVLRGRALVLRVRETDEILPSPTEYEIALTPRGDNLFTGRTPSSGAWQSFLFQRLGDGSECLHTLGRATPKVT